MMLRFYACGHHLPSGLPNPGLWVICGLLWGWGLPTLAAPPAVRIMSYNVRYASDDGPHAWSDRRPSARAMLEAFEPDIIGMQEALFRQVKDFQSDHPAFAWVGTGREGGSAGEFMAVFYRRARLEPLAFGHYWLSDTPDQIASITWGNACHRMVTWVTFRDQATDQRFHLINTHLDHRSAASREKSAALIVRRSAQLDPRLPTVLVGDFNVADATSSVYQTFLDAGFQDTWHLSPSTPEERDTFHGYTPDPLKDRGRRIDWILARGGVQVTHTRIVDGQFEGRYPSDHFPVLADCVFPESQP